MTEEKSPGRKRKVSFEIEGRQRQLLLLRRRHMPAITVRRPGIKCGEWGRNGKKSDFAGKIMMRGSGPNFARFRMHTGREKNRLQRPGTESGCLRHRRP